MMTLSSSRETIWYTALQQDESPGFSAGRTNMRDVSSVDPADSAAWRPAVRAAVARPAAPAALLPAAAVAEALLPAAEVEERGAPPEAADAPRLQAAVEAPGAPQEEEALGARVELVELEALGALPQPEVIVGVTGARPMATQVVGPAAVSGW